MARPGKAGHGAARQGEARRGRARRGAARQGKARITLQAFHFSRSHTWQEKACKFHTLQHLRYGLA